MKTLETIWRNRSERMKNKTWNGDDPRAGFDFSKGIREDIRYSSDNWNDLMISDFRSLLNQILDGFDYTDGFWESRNDPYNKVYITCDVINEQVYFFIKVSSLGAYSVSWYKRRGKIDSIVDLEYGEPMCLADFTLLLWALGLEEEPIVWEEDV